MLQLCRYKGLFLHLSAFGQIYMCIEESGSYIQTSDNNAGSGYQIYVDLSLYVVCSHSVGYTTRIGDFHIQHCAIPHLNMYNMIDLCTLKLHQLSLCTSMGRLLTTKNVKVSTRTHTRNASNTYARTSLL